MAQSEAVFAPTRARDFVRRASKFTYALSKLFPPPNRAYFLEWYAYLRWVDDWVDDGLLVRGESANFVKHQIDLLEHLYAAPAAAQSEGHNAVHPGLIHLIAYDRANGSGLKESLLDMLRTIEFDALRIGLVVDHSVLQAHFERIGVNYLWAIAYFCGLGTSSGYLPGREAAVGAKLVHVIRDFLTDAPRQLINISSDEVELYDLSIEAFLKNVDQPSARLWVAAKIRRADELLRVGLADAHNSRSLRYCLLIGILVAKYQAYSWQIRVRKFALRPASSLPMHIFIIATARNWLQVLLRPQRAQARDRGSIPAPIIPLSVLATANVYRKMSPLLNPVPGRAARSFFPNGQQGRASSSKRARRFNIGYQLGRDTYRWISSESKYSSHLPGLLFGLWVLLVVELDSLMDDGSISRAQSQALVDEWNLLVRSAIHDASARIEVGEDKTRFYLLSARFAQALRTFLLASPDNREGAKSFASAAQEFFRGQVMSSNQRTIDLRYDWSWYYREILDQKTVGFFLAPTHMWRRNAQSADRFDSLQRSFLKLNSAYFHWQLLDDVADLGEDTRAGLVTAPGYILLSQGGVASLCLQSAISEWDQGGIVNPNLSKEISQSDLLCRKFLDSPLCDPYRHVLGKGLKMSERLDAESALSLTRCALANTVADFETPVADLAQSRAGQARAFLSAMNAGNGQEAHRLIVESGTTCRLLDAAAEEGSRAAISAELCSVKDESLLSALAIIEALIRRTHLRARRAS